MGCGARSPRTAVQAALAALNPAAVAHMAALAAARTAEERQHLLRVGTSDDAFGVVRGVRCATMRGAPSRSIWISLSPSLPAACASTVTLGGRLDSLPRRVA